MATHSSVLAWRIPWIEEPSGLQSIGLQRVRHDQSDLVYKRLVPRHIFELQEQFLCFKTLAFNAFLLLVMTNKLFQEISIKLKSIL